MYSVRYFMLSLTIFLTSSRQRPFYLSKKFSPTNKTLLTSKRTSRFFNIPLHYVSLGPMGNRS